MKRLYFIILFALGYATSSFAQGLPKPGDYIERPTLTKFEGTWQWTNGNDTVKIFLRKEKFPLGDFFADQIVGFHLYKQGNVVIEDSYTNRNLPNSTMENRTYLATNRNGGDILSGILHDISKDKGLKLTLTLDNSHTTLTWQLRSAGMTVNSPSGMTLPRDIVLTKL